MSRVRVASIATCLALTTASGCGARTGLREPCAIELDRERPAVAFVVQWNASCHREAGHCPADELFAGRDLEEASRFTLANLVPILDPVARIGAIPTQTIALGDPIQDLPDGGWNPEWCAIPDTFAVPIGENQGASVEAYFAEDRWSIDPPNGQGTVLPLIPLVDRELTRVGTGRTPRWIILVDSGRRGCPDSPDDAVHIDDAAYAEIRDVFATAAGHGVRTLVVGMRAFTADGQPFLAEETILDAEAEGGGLPRSDDGLHPIRFYDYALPSAIEEVLDTELVRPYYCNLYPIAPVPDMAELSVDDDELPPARDTEHRDGWDFVNAARTSVRLFGPACDRAIASRSSFRFLVHGPSCWSGG